ncbi:sulfur carrier protein ThiS [Rubrivirga sp. IMCC45206]|uniref:sulfur carrier protein ThiS n=1 Tax=Rubrivirga sp. IMCC45206 TaxID=3391614 RepID=UPI0039903390
MPQITVNGEPRELAEPLAIDALLESLDRDPAMPGVAVAVGDRVVRRADWPTTTVSDGDRVEIITASQGG